MDTRRIASELARVTALATESVALVVIGNGLTGATIAREAAARGLVTVLVDQGDVAGGPGPSKQTLGGRLQHVDQSTLRLRMVSSRTGRALQAIAPHLVRSTSFVVPLHRQAGMATWTVATHALNRGWGQLFRNVRRHRLLGKRGLLELEPLVRDRGLLGGALYEDMVFDHGRLAVAMARAAERDGALVVPYAELVRLDRADGRIRGVTLRNIHQGTTAELRAGVVINASGPWIDSIRLLESPTAEPLVALRRRGYLAVPHARIGHRHAVSFVSPVDGQLLHLVRWGDRSVIGPSSAEVEHPQAGRVTDEDVVYLLRSVNAIFPNARLTREDIHRTWSQVDAHPGPDGDLGAAQNVEVGPHGLISVMGDAAKEVRLAPVVVDAAMGALESQGFGGGHAVDSTGSHPVPGSAHYISPLLQPGLDLGLAPATVEHLLETFGAEADAVYNLCREQRELMAPVHPDHPAILAEVVQVARRELVVTVDDVLTRRLNIRWETDDDGLAAAEATARIMARELGWDENARLEQIAAYQASTNQA